VECSWPSPQLLLVDEPVAGLTDEETEEKSAIYVDLAETLNMIIERRHGISNFDKSPRKSPFYIEETGPLQRHYG
jgi:ABC-type arginine transport system ATPase subunit